MEITSSLLNWLIHLRQYLFPVYAKSHQEVPAISIQNSAPSLEDNSKLNLSYMKQRFIFCRFPFAFSRNSFMWKFCNRLYRLLEEGQKKLTGTWKIIGRFLILEDTQKGSRFAWVDDSFDWSSQYLLYYITHTFVQLFAYAFTVSLDIKQTCFESIATKPQSHRRDSKKLF